MDSNNGLFYEELYIRAGQVFTPATPIQSKELFAGRLSEIARVADAVGQTGLHVAIYGERGVGKTSLANILNELPLGYETIRVPCDTKDTFGSAWTKLVRRLPAMAEAGFGADGDRFRAMLLPADPSPDDVLLFLERQGPLVCIFDEFDRLARSETSPFSDLIKALSDGAVTATVILVGVAESVTDLVQDHASIERALVQVEMPRMRPEELREIINRAAAQLHVTFTNNATSWIVDLSQGLPHYTHLLGRESVRAVAREQHRSVGVKAVRVGIQTAIQDAQETIRDQYANAVHSARSDALYREVLLACALGRKGDRSSFRAGDLIEPMSKIMGRPYEIPAFARHLKAFCEDEDRGYVLERSGKERNFVYRFRNPLMESYVLMRGIADEIYDPGSVSFTSD